MSYSVGCAFNMDDIFANFNFKRLSITCKQCKEINNDNHRNKLAKKIFAECIKIVINDIIDNNSIFHLPIPGAGNAIMYMRRYTGEEFQRARKNKKWRDIDILKSNFSGYEIVLKMYGNRTERYKTVYVDNRLKSKITNNVNNGKQY